MFTIPTTNPKVFKFLVIQIIVIVRHKFLFIHLKLVLQYGSLDTSLYQLPLFLSERFLNLFSYSVFVLTVSTSFRPIIPVGVTLLPN